MTRRIAFAILLIVWLVLLTAGVSTYYISQKLLVDDLDDVILGRIAALPELEPSSIPPLLQPGKNDTIVIKTPDGIHNLTPDIARTIIGQPVVLDRFFTTRADGTHYRTLAVQAYARRVKPTDPLVPVSVVYSATATYVTDLLESLLRSLIAFGLFAAVATAAVARSVAQHTTRPLREAAETIGNIDDRSLDRRIDATRLPVELLPMAHRLNELLARLETAFAQRRQFLADASHELRTPVAGMVTTLEVALRKQREPEEYQRILGTCLSDARLLQQLVVGLIEQVRTQRFGLELEIAPVSLASVIDDCARHARIAASVKQITLELELHPALLEPPDTGGKFPAAARAFFLADEQKMRSILTNLLSNAVAYTPSRGTVRLTAHLAPCVTVGHTSQASVPEEKRIPPALLAAVPEHIPPEFSTLTLIIDDDGPGISPQHMPHLFEPFFRADASRADPENHLGLGLAIVRACAQALGGDCAVQSPRSHHANGSSFTVHLPTLQIPEAEARPVMGRPAALPSTPAASQVHS